MSVRNIIFDLGGVLLIDRPEESLRRFDRLGFVEARHLLSPYPAEGLFPDLEVGRFSKEECLDLVRRRYGHALTVEDFTWALVGYAGEAELYKLDYLREQLTDCRSSSPPIPMPSSTTTIGRPASSPPASRWRATSSAATPLTSFI